MHPSQKPIFCTCFSSPLFFFHAVLCSTLQTKALALNSIPPNSYISSPKWLTMRQLRPPAAPIFSTPTPVIFRPRRSVSQSGVILTFAMAKGVMFAVANACFLWYRLVVKSGFRWWMERNYDCGCTYVVDHFSNDILIDHEAKLWPLLVLLVYRWTLWILPTRSAFSIGTLAVAVLPCFCRANLQI